MRQLLNLADFDSAVREGRLVGIFDKYTGDHLHVLPCPHVKRAYFHEKVVANGGKNGRYVQYNDLDEALAGIGDQPCKECFRGVDSLAALAGTAGFRASLQARRRTPREKTAPAPAHQSGARGDELGGSASVTDEVLVRWRGDSRIAFEAWCSRQLDLAGC